jgi:DNA invertase Pin-like site-specific DNA recombinase
MTTTDALTGAVAAQNAMTEAQEAFKAATTARDEAVISARKAGASAIEIGEALGISRQQVHKILDKHFAPAGSAVEVLRAEVITSGIRYEDLIEDDQIFVDQEIAQLAKKRGISLD